MPTKALNVLRIGRIRTSFAAILLLSAPSKAFLRPLSSFPTAHLNLHDFFGPAHTMVSTRYRRVSTATTTFVEPATVLSATKTGSQKEKKVSPAVTPSPSRKRRRTTKSPSPKTKGSASKKELNFAPALTAELVASINPDQEYVDLSVPPAELRPSATLTTGQCFHWKAVETTSNNDKGVVKKESAWGTHNAST